MSAAKGKWVIGKRLRQGSKMMTAGARGVLKAPDWREGLARVFILGLTLSMLVTAMALHPWIGIVLGLVWFVTALVISRPRTPRKPAKERKATPPATEPAADLHPDDLAELLHELAEDRNGVHLSRVAEQLTEESDRPWSTNDVRTVLKAAGVPVRHSVRVAGAVSPGVHREDLPPTPSPTAGEGSRSPVAPQVSAATATATPRVREFADGTRAVFTPDETNPVRTHIRWLKPGEAES